jgi:hypothetical protein
MLIEYKIKFEKDGLTIAQQIEPNTPTSKAVTNGKARISGLPATQQTVSGAAVSNPLVKIPADGGGQPFGDTGGQPFGDTGGQPFGDTGGAPGGSAPIFILGPIVFGNAAYPEMGKPADSDSAGGDTKTRGASAGQ